MCSPCVCVDMISPTLKSKDSFPLLTQIEKHCMIWFAGKICRVIKGGKAQHHYCNFLWSQIWWAVWKQQQNQGNERNTGVFQYFQCSALVTFAGGRGDSGPIVGWFPIRGVMLTPPIILPCERHTVQQSHSHPWIWKAIPTNLNNNNSSRSWKFPLIFCTAPCAALKGD